MVGAKTFTFFHPPTVPDPIARKPFRQWTALEVQRHILWPTSKLHRHITAFSETGITGFALLNMSVEDIRSTIHGHPTESPPAEHFHPKLILVKLHEIVEAQTKSGVF